MKVGRPKSTHCKRGHERQPDELSCVACRRFRERWKYESDAVFRQKKLDYQVQWRKDFFAANGYWAGVEKRVA